MGNLIENSNNLWLQNVCDFENIIEKKAEGGQIALNKKQALNNFMEIGSLTLECQSESEEKLVVYIDINAWDIAISKKALLLSLKFLLDLLSNKILTDKSFVLSELVVQLSGLILEKTGNGSSKFPHVCWDLFPTLAIGCSVDAIALNSKEHISLKIEFNDSNLMSILLS